MRRSSFPIGILLFFLVIAAVEIVSAANKTAQEIAVEWYQPEIEKSKIPGAAYVIISGKTEPSATVEIDSKQVTLIRGLKRKGKKFQAQGLKDYSVGKATANREGYFEVAMDFPQGLLQIPILVRTSQQQERTFLITFQVTLNKVKMNTKISRNKPPAAAKSLRLWMGFGSTHQTYKQTVGGLTDVSFANTDSPSMLFRAGYWKGNWGLDLFYRSAPGKIDNAVEPFRIASTQYRWQTYEIRGHYQFQRSDSSRMLGLPSQWLLLFGTQIHRMPFLVIDTSNEVNILESQLAAGTLGVGLLLGQERDWSYEFAFEAQYPLSVSGPEGNELKISPTLAYDARLGVNYKIATNWRVGFFAYVQSHSYSFDYTQDANVTSSGQQSLFYSTFDVHLGYEY